MKDTLISSVFEEEECTEGPRTCIVRSYFDLESNQYIGQRVLIDTKIIDTRSHFVFFAQASLAHPWNKSEHNPNGFVSGMRRFDNGVVCKHYNNKHQIQYTRDCDGVTQFYTGPATLVELLSS